MPLTLDSLCAVIPARLLPADADLDVYLSDRVNQTHLLSLEALLSGEGLPYFHIHLREGLLAPHIALVSSREKPLAIVDLRRGKAYPPRASLWVRFGLRSAPRVELPAKMPLT